MERIRVDGGKIDLGEGIIRRIEAEKLVRESREKLPVTMMVYGQLEHPLAAYEALLADPDISFRRLGAVYRPSVLSRNRQSEHGKWSIKLAGQCVERICARHRFDSIR
jgi:hypothetical protein